jgi:polysaccharide export outer membrane protein
VAIILVVFGLPFCGVGLARATEQTTANFPQALPTEVELSELHAAATHSAVVDGSTYVLGIGERVKISVYGRKDLSADYRVDDQGRVRIPMLGPFDAAGRTPAQLKRQSGSFGALIQRP